MAPQSPFEDVQGKDVTFPNLSPFGPQLRTREDNYVESIVNNVLRKDHLTILSQRGFQYPKAKALNRIGCSETGGCIFLHSRLYDIFDNGHDVTVSPGNYDVVIITKDLPVSILTVTGDDRIDEGTIRYNQRLTSKLRRFLLNFTDQNITTLCAVVDISVLSDTQQLLEILKAKLDEASEVMNSDKLYMDEKKRDDATHAFLASLAFLNPRTSSGICLHPREGNQDVLYCMTPAEFCKLYGELRGELKTKSRFNFPSVFSGKRKVPWLLILMWVLCVMYLCQILRGNPNTKNHTLINQSITGMYEKSPSLDVHGWNYTRALNILVLSIHLHTSSIQKGNIKKLTNGRPLS